MCLPRDLACYYGRLPAVVKLNRTRNLGRVSDWPFRLNWDEELAGSGSPQDRSLEVLLLLRSHGLRLRAAQMVARLGEALRQRTEQTGLEYAALVDDGTGEQVGEVLEGETSHVNLRPHLTALQPGRRYAHVHTHPGSTTFSADDLSILLAHPPLRTPIVVGADGSWYFLSKLRGQPTANPEEGIAEWLDEFATLTLRYSGLVQSGVLTRAHALRRQAYEALGNIAPRLRLRYDRLEHG